MVNINGPVKVKKPSQISKFSSVPDNIKHLVREDFKSEVITDVLIDENFTVVKSNSFKITYYKDTLIYKSAKPRGKDLETIDGIVKEVIADDLKYGDLSNKEILSINKFYTNWIDELIFTYTKNGKQSLGKNFKEMAKIFTIGSKEMPDVVQDMINKFLEGKGKSYSNKFLTKNVKKNMSFKNYHKDIQNLLKSNLIEQKGNIYKLKATKKKNFIETSRYDGIFQKEAEKNVERPKFIETGDLINGLKIAINQVWGCSVTVKNYRVINDNYYKGTIEHTLHDNFGLNKNDVDLKNFSKKIYMSGIIEGVVQISSFQNIKLAFDDWFVLQRSKELHKKIIEQKELPPKPFIVDMIINEEFNFKGN